MNLKMTNQAVITHYFTEIELSTNDADLVPLISDKKSFSDLAQLASVSKHRCVLVKSESGLLINIVTQGDILRYSNRNSCGEKRISDVIGDKSSARTAINSVQAQIFINEQNFSAVPIVDTENMLIGVSVPSTSDKSADNSNIRPIIGLVMSGGRGSRLYPLTEDTPKPLLPLGRQSILEHVLDSLEYAGVQRCVLMAGHLSEKFFEFKEKSYRQLSIFVEDNPLGTGGPLLKWFKDDRSEINAYLKKWGSFTLLVCNGDLIFDLSRQIVSDFEESGDQITLIARNHRHPVKFGVLSIDKESYLNEFKEKPVYEFLVNTGIYLFKIDNTFLESCDTLEITKIDMPDLLAKLEKEFGIKVRVQEIVGNYIDLGTKEDLIEISTFFRE